MKTFPLCLIVALFLSLVAITPSHAVNSINVQTFSPSTSDHFVYLEDGLNADWPKSAKYFFGFNYNYVSEPLVVLDSTQTTKVQNVIDSIQTVDLMFGFKASRRFGLFVGLPVHFVAFPSSTILAGYPTGGATAMGDLKLLGKIRITDENSNTAITLNPEFHLPTGATADFVSDASTLVGFKFALERQFESFTLDVVAGYAYVANAIYTDPNFTGGIDYRQRLNLGVGGFLPFTDHWGMNAEFNSNSPIPFIKTLSPNEFYLGLRHVPVETWVATAGIAIGKIGGPTSMDYRLIAGIRHTLYDETRAAPAAPRPLPVPAAPAPPTQQLVIMHSTHVQVLREVSFEHGSATLTPDGQLILTQMAKVLLDNKKYYTKIMVDGHTNRLGNDAYNVALSLARARTVTKFLTAHGVPPDALEARGYGYRKPKLPYSDPNAMEANRRVEFIVVK